MAGSCSAVCWDSFSLGSIVQKGKFSAAAALLVRMLKKVDFLQEDKRRTTSASHTLGSVYWGVGNGEAPLHPPPTHTKNVFLDRTPTSSSQ